jgi:FtsH-binding integral membrane protein
MAKRIGIMGMAFAAYMLRTAYVKPDLNIILLVFALILLIMSSIDLFRKPDPSKAASLHGGRMGGAFIASVTAFLVVNNDFMHPLIAWLGPTVIGSPLIALGIRNFYRRKR